VHQKLGPGQVRTWEAKRGVEDASYFHDTTIRSCGVVTIGGVKAGGNEHECMMSAGE
jgi:hypothetical protein